MTSPLLNRITFGKGEDITLALRSRNNDAATISAVTAKLRPCLPGKLDPDPNATATSLTATYVPQSGGVNDGYTLAMGYATADVLPRGNYILDAVLSFGTSRKLTTRLLVVLAVSASG